MDLSIFSEWQYSVVNDFIHQVIEEARDGERSEEDGTILQEQGS